MAVITVSVGSTARKSTEELAAGEIKAIFKFP